jgi:hypothetical protein
MGKTINTIKRNTEAALDTSKKVDLEINAKKTKLCSCFITRMQYKIIIQGWLINPLKI